VRTPPVGSSTRRQGRALPGERVARCSTASVKWVHLTWLSRSSQGDRDARRDPAHAPRGRGDRPCRERRTRRTSRRLVSSRVRGAKFTESTRRFDRPRNKFDAPTSDLRRGRRQHVLTRRGRGQVETMKFKVDGAQGLLLGQRRRGQVTSKSRARVWWSGDAGTWTPTQEGARLHRPLLVAWRSRAFVPAHGAGTCSPRNPHPVCARARELLVEPSTYPACQRYGGWTTTSACRSLRRARSPVDLVTGRCPDRRSRAERRVDRVEASPAPGQRRRPWILRRGSFVTITRRENRRPRSARRSSGALATPRRRAGHRGASARGEEVSNHPSGGPMAPRMLGRVGVPPRRGADRLGSRCCSCAVLDRGVGELLWALALLMYAGRRSLCSWACSRLVARVSRVLALRRRLERAVLRMGVYLSSGSPRETWSRPAVVATAFAVARVRTATSTRRRSRGSPRARTSGRTTRCLDLASSTRSPRTSSCWAPPLVAWRMRRPPELRDVPRTLAIAIGATIVAAGPRSGDRQRRRVLADAHRRDRRDVLASSGLRDRPGAERPDPAAVRFPP